MTEIAQPAESAPALMWAMELDGRGGARSLTAAELAARDPGEGVLWLHLDITGHGAQALIDDACLRFDLSPKEADYLIKFYKENT